MSTSSIVSSPGSSSSASSACPIGTSTQISRMSPDVLLCAPNTVAGIVRETSRLGCKKPGSRITVHRYANTDSTVVPHSRALMVPEWRNSLCSTTSATKKACNVNTAAGATMRSRSRPRWFVEGAGVRAL
eukprot:CAMPEP_0194519766 /NCGR_PEP_ID=MMETSP0253-20130528/53517_1 /TAXON_ID=2966 /ORGANISM="Noctiluca scintillans" /LENGTH=129 /DNA_ID=CAMNT_0039363933 /DNA_START=618 /DNA_END=1004 /DNA_ORIENTATION=-